MIQRLPRLLLPLLLFAALLAAPSSVHAQSPAGGYTPSTVATTGFLGPTISYYYNLSAPSTHTVDWSVAGTHPTACTFELTGSSDNAHFHSLTGAQSCADFTVTGTTTSGSQSVTGVSNTLYMLPGQAISGSCLAAGTTVASVSANAFTLSTNAISSGSCTITDAASYGALHVVSKPWVYLNINILTYTAADGTTAITFGYTRGN